MGDRADNLQKAIDALVPYVQLTAVSPVYETAPYGVLDQPTFYNMCVAGQTRQSPTSLLHTVKLLENMLGRQPTQRWGPRAIDIDILFYDQLYLHTDDLIIPHVGISDRAFVLFPLNDIASDLHHPKTGLTVQEMKTAVDDHGVTRLDSVIITHPTVLA